jgi:hypothetical protein
MCINPTSQRTRGSGLMESLVAMGIVSLIALVVTTLFTSSTTQIARALNYCDMNAASQEALDILSRDIRNANRVTLCTNYGSHAELELEDATGARIKYIYKRGNMTLSRNKGAIAKVLLRECESMTVALSKRNPYGGMTLVPNSSVAECKAIAVSWKCARSIQGQKTTHENVSSGQIVLRRQRI